MPLLSAKCPRPTGRLKTPYERRFGESFKGPIIPLGALVEYLQNDERDKARIHQFGKNVLPGSALIAGRIWKGVILIADIEELQRLDASQKTVCKRSPDNPQRRRICISCGRWFINIFRKRLRIPRIHSETGTHRKKRDSQRRISRR